MIWVVGSQHDGDYVSNELVESGVNENIVAKDYLSKNVTECFDRVLAFIKDRTNPPYLYFVGSVWLREIYDSVVLSKLKGYRIQFEGALDHRPVKEVEEEKLLDAPRKGLEHYKEEQWIRQLTLYLTVCSQKKDLDRRQLHFKNEYIIACGYSDLEIIVA